jgi:hypothetical protein
MLGTQKSTQSVIAAITLCVVAVLALRGYLPGVERATEGQRPQSNPAATVVVVAMVSAAVAIIGFAIVAHMRDRKPRAAAGALPRSAGGTGRLSWRYTVLALAVVIGWLLLIVALSDVTGGGRTQEARPEPPPAHDAGTPPSRTDTAPPQAPTGDGSNVVGYLIPPMLALVMLVIAGSVVASKRQGRTTVAEGAVDIPEGPTLPIASDSLARAAEVGLAEIGDLTREPREAIIACYAAMERELTRVPDAMPQEFDTPSEVLARAVAHRALKADSATELVDLFEEARFSVHVMTEAHRDAAVRVLRRVLAELPQAARA